MLLWLQAGFKPACVSFDMEGQRRVAPGLQCEACLGSLKGTVPAYRGVWKTGSRLQVVPLRV